MRGSSRFWWEKENDVKRGPLLKTSEPDSSWTYILEHEKIKRRITRAREPLLDTFISNTHGWVGVCFSYSRREDGNRWRAGWWWWLPRILKTSWGFEKQPLDVTRRDKMRRKEEWCSISRRRRGDHILSRNQINKVSKRKIKSSDDDDDQMTIQ